MLTEKRLLIINIKTLITKLRVASASQVSDLVTQFEDNKSSIKDFKVRAKNIRDPSVSHSDVSMGGFGGQSQTPPPIDDWKRNKSLSFCNDLRFFMQRLPKLLLCLSLLSNWLV